MCGVSDPNNVISLYYLAHLSQFTMSLLQPIVFGNCEIKYPGQHIKVLKVGRRASMYGLVLLLPSHWDRVLCGWILKLDLGLSARSRALSGIGCPSKGFNHQGVLYLYVKNSAGIGAYRR